MIIESNPIVVTENPDGPDAVGVLATSSPNKTRFPKLLLNEPSQASIKIIQQSPEVKVNDPTVLQIAGSPLND